MLQAGETDSAAWAFRRAIDLLPGSPDAWKRLAVVENTRGDRGAAAEALETALALGGEPALHGLLARLYRDMPGSEAAARLHLEAYARLLGTNPAEAERRLPEMDAGRNPRRNASPDRSESDQSRLWIGNSAP
jgi:predicted TPR repeat methyltransferase